MPRFKAHLLETITTTFQWKATDTAAESLDKDTQVDLVRTAADMVGLLVVTLYIVVAVAVAQAVQENQLLAVTKWSQEARD